METYSDIFHEQIVKKEKTQKDTLLKAGIIFLAIVLILASFRIPIPMIGPVIIVAAIWGAYYFVKNLNLEFEYSVTNNYLDIAKIMNKSRRKEIYSIDCKTVTKMGKIPAGANRDQNNGGGQVDKVVDVTSMTNKDNVYYIVFKNSNQTIKLYFEPNENILEACKKVIPRAAQI